MAGQGVNGFGSFCQNKRISAAGPRPGKYRLGQEVRKEGVEADLLGGRNLLG